MFSNVPPPIGPPPFRPTRLSDTQHALYCVLTIVTFGFGGIFYLLTWQGAKHSNQQRYDVWCRAMEQYRRDYEAWSYRQQMLGRFVEREHWMYEGP